MALVFITLRAYQLTDWEAVCRIHDAARLQELAGGGVDPRAFKPMVAAADEDEFHLSERLVACADDQAVGFVAWNRDYITWLYVDPIAQRRGIGKQLLRAALQRIGPEAWTNCIGGNEPATQLYLAEGLELVWDRPGDCEGFPCRSLRLALPTSRMRDPAAKRQRQ
jgi:GNAT superfamily N-acetyltransferase